MKMADWTSLGPRGHPFLVQTVTRRLSVEVAKEELPWMTVVYLVAEAVACHHDVLWEEAEVHDPVILGMMLLCRVLANRQRVFENLWASPSFPQWLASMLRLDPPKLRLEDCESWQKSSRLGARMPS